MTAVGALMKHSRLNRIALFIFPSSRSSEGWSGLKYRYTNSCLWVLAVSTMTLFIYKTESCFHAALYISDENIVCVHISVFVRIHSFSRHIYRESYTLVTELTSD